jgi:hypothetical protein
MMQAYKFNTHISDKGVILLPFEPVLFDKEVELIVIPKIEKAAAPQGYMGLEEFRAESKRSLRKILNENGVY